MSTGTVESVYSCVDPEMVKEFCERYDIPDSLNLTGPSDGETSLSHPEMVVVYLQSFFICQCSIPF